MSPRHSVPCLTVRLPLTPDGFVEHQPNTGAAFRHQLGALPDRLRAGQVWQRIEEKWHYRRSLLTAFGAELGKWLYGERAAAYLRTLTDAWSEGMPLHRIELRVPRELAEWPWELATLEGIGPPAVHRALTVVRQSDQVPPPAEPPPQLAVEVMGVQHDRPGPWEPLQVREELERVRLEIEQAGSRGRFAVRVDPLGGWSELVQRCQRIGPPHVFHFAGHGLDDGRGLVFRGADGGPEEIAAEQIAVLLARVVRGRQTRLAFLNACSGVAAGKRRLQPFGGLGMVLIQHGIPMVVGMQVPLLDGEAQHMAAAFYQELAGGGAVDCAVQAARERLYLSGGGVGWAFLSVSVSGAPAALWRAPTYQPADRPSARFLAFGHPQQRQRLEHFLLRRTPMVVLIPGEAGSGHRYVAQRVQHDLEKAGNTLWRPVAAMRWFVAGEPLLSRSQLAAGIARALGIADTGTPAELEARLARDIAERCSGERVLVIDMVEVLSLPSETHADALVSLVHEVFSDLMDGATAYTSSLPVYLLLSVAYPKPLPPTDRRAARVQEQISRTERALVRLGEKKRLKARVRVEILPKLEPIEERYVADFLEEVLELDPDTAECMAQNQVGLDDNETILTNIAQLLSDWEGR